MNSLNEVDGNRKSSIRKLKDISWEKKHYLIETISLWNMRKRVVGIEAKRDWDEKMMRSRKIARNRNAYKVIKRRGIEEMKLNFREVRESGWDGGVIIN